MPKTHIKNDKICAARFLDKISSSAKKATPGSNKEIEELKEEALHARQVP